MLSAVCGCALNARLRGTPVKAVLADPYFNDCLCRLPGSCLLVSDDVMLLTMVNTAGRACHPRRWQSSTALPSGCRWRCRVGPGCGVAGGGPPGCSPGSWSRSTLPETGTSQPALGCPDLDTHKHTRGRVPQHASCLSIPQTSHCSRGLKDDIFTDRLSIGSCR